MYDEVCMYDRSCEYDGDDRNDVHCYELQWDDEHHDVDDEQDEFLFLKMLFLLRLKQAYLYLLKFLKEYMNLLNLMMFLY